MTDSSLAAESMDDAKLTPGVKVVEEIPCPTPGCKGKGVRYVFGGATVDGFCEQCVEQAEREADERERAEIVEGYMERAGLTPRLREFTLDGYFTDEAGVAARNAVEKWRSRVLAWREDPVKHPVAPNLLLYGSVGSGKTGLVAPVVRSLCEQMIGCRFVDFPTLLEEIKDAYAKKVPLERMSDLVRVPVLVLDDLGGERPTEWAVSQLLRLVNTRYERKLPTCFLSNFTPGELAKRLGHEDPVAGERIVSRMVEGAIQHRMRARDRRTT